MTFVCSTAAGGSIGRARDAQTASSANDSFRFCNDRSDLPYLGLIPAYEREACPGARGGGGMRGVGGGSLLCIGPRKLLTETPEVPEDHSTNLETARIKFSRATPDRKSASEATGKHWLVLSCMVLDLSLTKFRRAARAIYRQPDALLVVPLGYFARHATRRQWGR